MTSTEYLFWTCMFMTLYPYALYPLVVAAWSKASGRKWIIGTYQPKTSMIISVHNEEKVIRSKIDNALALAYSNELLEILVVSDGSTDSTEDIVSSFTDPRIKLLSFERAGKTACLNRAVAQTRGDVLVFTDANSMFPNHTLANIARNFADPNVGLVTGWTKYRKPGSDVEEAPGVYARLEKYTKLSESLISSCVGADGAIFGLRRELYRDLEDHDINDFIIPLHVLDQNQRVVLDPEVYCLEEPSGDAEREFARQARITNRTLGAIKRNMRFLNPARFGSFSFFLLSHKILRFMTPFFALGLFSSSIALVNTGATYFLASVGLSIFIISGVLGITGLINSRMINLSSAFLLTNLAQLKGWFRFLTGCSDTMWAPKR
jgi:cellulose synthase/poly-beta-1,6-N-acetylglucosamine synthase-like glycosyltransferase